MKKDVLRFIKNDMWELRHNKKYLQARLKDLLAKIESDRKAELAENKSMDVSPESKAWFNRQTNAIYDRHRIEAIDNEFSSWHNDQGFYLIYKDGSDVYITAEDILGGEPFPKMSGIVYAELSSADDHMDTVTGDLDFYSEERLAACDYDYEVEDERKWQYEMAIQYKFGTEWSKRYSRLHPDFIPEET